MKDTEPIGQHLGEDEDVDESPGLVNVGYGYHCVHGQKTGDVGVILSPCFGKVTSPRFPNCVCSVVDVLTAGRIRGKVVESEWKLGHQDEKQGWDDEAVNSLNSELGLGFSEQGEESIEA